MNSDIFLRNSSSADTPIITKTYILLALSMIPTIIGAIAGVQMGIVQSIFAITGPLMFFILNLVVMMGLIIAIEKIGDTPLGVGLLMCYTFISGIMLSVTLQRALNIPNGAELIAIAFGGTMAIFAGMATLNKVLNRDLGFMGKGLMIAVIALIVASIMLIFLKSALLYVLITVASLIIFSMFLLYDLNQIIRGGVTSYVSATLALYIDLMAIFRALLNILMMFSGRSDD